MSSEKQEMKTRVVQLRKGSSSLRSVIPQAYVQLLALKNGDELEWTHEIEKVTGQIIVKVKKV